MKTEIVGYVKGTSKKTNKPFCVVHTIQEFSPDRPGCVGRRADSIFLPDDCVDLLKPTDIGKEIIFSYNISGGRAFLEGVSVK